MGDDRFRQAPDVGGVIGCRTHVQSHRPELLRSFLGLKYKRGNRRTPKPAK